MSYEIGQAKALGVNSKTSSNADISARLPEQCSVPGYWNSLAQNADSWASEITAGPLWREVNHELEGWKKEYRRKFLGTLNTGEALAPFIGKSADRIQEKTLEKIRRAKDIETEVKAIFDQSVPVPRIEDLVRVRLKVQFLDGVPFLATKIHDVAKKYDGNAEIEPKGNLNGYFAQHLRFRLPVYFRFGGQPISCDVTCEVQIATALATHVWENSHGLYENTRVNLEKSEDWQWNPRDPRFLSRQLGHMIHLADGLFCNLRDISGNENARKE